MFTKINSIDLPSNIKDLHKVVCGNRLKVDNIIRQCKEASYKDREQLFKDFMIEYGELAGVICFYHINQYEVNVVNKDWAVLLDYIIDSLDIGGSVYLENGEISKYKEILFECEKLKHASERKVIIPLT